MSLRSRLVISLTTAALALGGAVTPAVAGDDGHHAKNNPRLYKGVVTASTLLLRSAPHRGSQVIGSLHRGQKVKIFCKTVGENINGNNRWYLLPDGTWAWAAAYYIKNIGPAPRWC
ncbi:SH3 domain-containing protein [Streptomyces sp. enrichment culture]|uniref:SH3 domain-containing protein n=1 Tax=Streptomyces sp. enrichment culture TaxID=1795815 RepID=UPI003F56D268